MLWKFWKTLLLWCFQVNQLLLNVYLTNLKNWIFFARFTVQIREIPRTPTCPEICHLQGTVGIRGFLCYILLPTAEDTGEAKYFVIYFGLISAFKFSAVICWLIKFFCIVTWLLVIITIIFVLQRGGGIAGNLNSCLLIM